MRSLALLLCLISVVNGLGDRSFICEDYDIENEYPFLARIMYGNDLICGGTIISNQYILTSAECVYKSNRTILFYRREPNDLVVFVGADFEYEDGGVRYLVGEIQRHRVHKARRISAIALLRVVEDIKFSSAIQPIKLSSNTNFPAGKMATLIGWDAEMCMAGEREEKILPQESCTELYRICTLSEIDSYYDPCFSSLWLQPHRPCHKPCGPKYGKATWACRITVPGSSGIRHGFWEKHRIFYAPPSSPCRKPCSLPNMYHAKEGRKEALKYGKICQKNIRIKPELHQN
nr:PREDICTED: kallikrein-7-like [Megachile rotundata]